MISGKVSLVIVPCIAHCINISIIILQQQTTDINSSSYHFDYIITGSGAAGFSLLYRMMQHSFFLDKRIMVIDSSSKTQNDRTWCFWEKNAGIFESVVYKKWKQIDFYSTGFSARFDLIPYEYKMIRSADLYKTVKEKATAFPNINFLKGTVSAIQNKEKYVEVLVDEISYTSTYVFNSILFKNILLESEKVKGRHYLLQHFKGWFIETRQPLFEPQVATFMDFRVSQNHGTTFVYVLPVSSNKALVEYTLFTEELLKPQQYDEALKNYISGTLQITDYTITEEEFGVIPMTDHPFKPFDGNIINIGTAGGQTKSSSGYTFQFIQKQSDFIIGQLMNGENPQTHPDFKKWKANMYDGALLHVLKNRKMEGQQIFSRLFKKNGAGAVFKFLDNETSLIEDINLLSGLPVSIFLPSAIKELLKKKHR